MFIKKILLCCFLTSVLAACGDGGGDGGSDGIDLSPSSLSFAGIEGSSIPAQTVKANIGTSPSQRHVGVTNKSPDLVTVTYKITHILDAYSITITPVNGLKKGSYSGTVDALVCKDSACNDVTDRGAINYTITIS
ncbi:MAG: hypothetical protein V4632_10385 [Pseudomonadota bacterium]